MGGERRGQLKRKVADVSLPFPASSSQSPEHLATSQALNNLSSSNPPEERGLELREQPFTVAQNYGSL